MSASATPSKQIKLSTRSQERLSSNQILKSSLKTRSWSKTDKSFENSEENSGDSFNESASNDCFSSLVIDERDLTERSTQNKQLHPVSLTASDLLKRKRKSGQTDEKEIERIGQRIISVESESTKKSAENMQPFKTTSLRKHKASPRIKVQPENVVYQMPRTRAQRKLYVQQGFHGLRRPNIDNTCSGSHQVSQNRNESVEAVPEEQKITDSKDRSENDSAGDQNESFPQGYTDDGVISFTTDMYSDHDIGDARIINLEQTVHDDIISGSQSHTKHGPVEKSKQQEVNGKISSSQNDNVSLSELPINEQTVNISDGDFDQEPDSAEVEDSDSSSHNNIIDNNYVYTISCPKSAAEETFNVQEFVPLKHTDTGNSTSVLNDSKGVNDSENGTGENQTVPNNMSEMETECSQILCALSQGSLSRVESGNNLQCVERVETEPSPGITHCEKSSICETKSKRKIKSTKALRHKTYESEVSFAQVGESAKIFLQKHPLLHGIYLNKGKREVKRNLIKLKRHQCAIDKGSYLRNGRINDKNRIDDMFEYTEEGKKRKDAIDENNARDEYVVNWYMWCPGHGNCLRKCGGYGQCVKGKYSQSDCLKGMDTIDRFSAIL